MPFSLIATVLMSVRLLLDGVAGYLLCLGVVTVPLQLEGTLWWQPKHLHRLWRCGTNSVYSVRVSDSYMWESCLDQSSVLIAGHEASTGA